MLTKIYVCKVTLTQEIKKLVGARLFTDKFLHQINPLPATFIRLNKMGIIDQSSNKKDFSPFKKVAVFPL
jgi:hypothetical protein